MKFKVDENLPAEICTDLRGLGHDAQTVPDEGLSGSPDETLLKRVQHEERIFLTLDKGIADVRLYPPDRYSGIILFRPPSFGQGTVLAFVRRHLPGLLQLKLDGRLLIVTDRAVRIR